MSHEKLAIDYVAKLRESQLFNGVQPAVVDRLLDNVDFLRYGGLMAAPPGVRLGSMESMDELRLHVGANLAANDTAYNQLTWKGFEKGELTTHPVHFFTRETHLGAVLKLQAHLLSRLIQYRGQGNTIQTLARYFIPPEGSGLVNDVKPDAVDLYLHSRGWKFHPDQKEARNWSQREWLRALETMEGIEADTRTEIAQAILEGRQPYVSLKLDTDTDIPLHAETPWGVYLEALTSDEIRKLAEHGYRCHPECACYHGYVDIYKQLARLIAPVDPTIIGERLLANYYSWLEDAILKPNNKRGSFRVLIPAQADETTIMGVLDYLKSHSVTPDELRENFSLVLADLCETPLLRIYAALKDRDLLPISNIVTMDAFAWEDEYEDRFHFIAADHFIDLFSQEGLHNQHKLLIALSNALTPDGELVLTARCGTPTSALTKKAIMDRFYGLVDTHIENLLLVLESKNDLKSTPFTSKYKVARAIYALLVYRQLREVYPFREIRQLETLLEQVTHDTGDTVTCAVELITDEKARIIIQKSSEF